MKLFLSLLALLVLIDCADAAVFSNSPDADAFVWAANPGSNYGAAGALTISGPAANNGSGATNGVFDSFIRFNSGTLVTNFNSLFGPGNWVVNGATLQVTEVGMPNNTNFNRGVGAFEIRWLANTNWMEGSGTPMLPMTNGITYADELNLLNSNTDATLGVFTNAGVDGARAFSLGLPAAFVNGIRAGGEVGLFLTAVDPGTGFTMNSRNFGTASLRPVLVISAVPVPVITWLQKSGTDLVLTATNGAAGGTYYVLQATNLGAPLSQWQPVASTLLSSNGEFSLTLTNAAGANAPPRQFFILQTH